MKPITVKNQVRLGPGRGMSLTLAGMYYRMTRSVITVVIVSLAVAFFSYILCYSVIVQQRALAAFDELKEKRQLGEWISRMNGPDQEAVVCDNLIAANRIRTTEYRRFAPCTDEQFAAISRKMHSYGRFLSYFSRIQPTSRAILLGDADPHRLPEQLGDSASFAVFVKQVGELSLKLPLDSAEALRRFVRDEYPDIRAYAAAVRAGNERALETVRAGFGGRSLMDVLLNGGADAVAVLREAGFHATGPVFKRLTEQAEWDEAEKSIVSLIAVPDVKTAIERKTGIKQADLDLSLLLGWITGENRARTVHALFKDVSTDRPAPSPGLLLVVAGNFQRSARLQKIVIHEEIIRNPGMFSLPSKTRWLVVVSFLVCVMGICNTMFMSVTERFTEIATMKCLGAMDGFIMMLFVFESILQGVAGSMAGLALGFSLALARGLSGYGMIFFEDLPWGGIFTVVGASFLMGVVLSAVAAVGPAWMAARLAPMEAMRVE